MTKLPPYSSRLKKDITLPSGYVVTIEKFNVLSAPFLKRAPSETDGDAGIRVSTFILTHKTGPLDGKKIVEKVTNPETEIELTSIDQADVDCIVQSAMEFSGHTARAAEARSTFPEGQSQPQPHRNGAPAGDAVSRDTSDAVA